MGISRKSIISELTIKGYKSIGLNKNKIDSYDRLCGSISFAIHGYNNGIQIIRTHDVFETHQAN